MSSEKIETGKRWGLKLLLVLFDIMAVNFSYFMALVLRFYVNKEFHLAGTLFMPLFLKFAPWYTVCCLIVFSLFGLYRAVLRYAGWNDLNRVVLANIVTCVIHIAGTLLFIRRMPITYYALGAAIQLFLICLSRFSYRLFLKTISHYSNSKSEATINVMIVGAGETARGLLRQLEEGDGNIARPVCVVDLHSDSKGKLFDGLPIVNGIEAIPAAAEKYGVRSVIIADPLMRAETRMAISDICREHKLNLQNFSGFTQTITAGISLAQLLQLVKGPISVSIDGNVRDFEDSEQAIAALPGKYVVKALSAPSGRLTAEVQKDHTVINSMDAAWVADYEQETGEPVSFF